MWINNNFFKVPVGERLELNYKLELAYKKRSVNFSVDSDSFNSETCYMQYNPKYNEYSFICGSFWFEESNVLPVVAMAHELGHYLDVRDNFDFDLEEYFKTLGTKELEVRAWLYAIDICREIGFNRWDVFFRYAKHCLGTYFNDPFSLNDFRFGFTGQEPTFENALMRLQERIGIKKIYRKVENVPSKQVLKKKQGSLIALKKHLKVKSWEL